jgi:hypothetical protein
MKGLTLTQPWASLIQISAKRIETRSWSTSYRGPIAIHAAQGLGPVGGVLGLADQVSQSYFFDALFDGKAGGVPPLPRGAIVAVAELVSIVPTKTLDRHDRQWNWTSPQGRLYEYTLTDQERAFGDYSPGRYAWLLADIRPLREPVPYKGALSLWSVPPAVQEQIKVQL